MDVLTLLREARAAGLHLRADGDNLVVEGPRTAAPIVEKLRQHKADILAALGAPCCPACGRRNGPPIDIADGCQAHHITPEMTARWWALAQEMDRTVSWCHCCGGPSPNGALRCRRCEGEI
jgi:ribosomal protein L40E